MVDCLAREFGYYVEKSPDVGTAWHLDIPGWNRGLCLDNDGSYYHLTADRPLRPPILTFNEFYALLKIFLRGAQTS